jgi:DNA replication protein DnaC
MGTLIDPQEERVFSALKRLQLPHLRETLPAVLSEAAKEQWTYLEFLERILGREVDAKDGTVRELSADFDRQASATKQQFLPWSLPSLMSKTVFFFVSFQ